MLTFAIYLMGICTGLTIILCIISAVLLVAIIIAICVRVDGSYERNEKMWIEHIIKKLIIFMLLCVFLAVAIPSKKTIATMLVIPTLVKQDPVLERMDEKTRENLYKLTENWVKNDILEMEDGVEAKASAKEKDSEKSTKEKNDGKNDG